MYAPVALAFVVVYKASRMMNFALGEWLMLGSRLVATGLHALGLGLVGAVGFRGAVMAGAGRAFSPMVLRRIVGPPLLPPSTVTNRVRPRTPRTAGTVVAGIP